jgi:hypothetical protein
MELADELQGHVVKHSRVLGLASAHRKSSVFDVKFKTIKTQTDFQTSSPSNISQIF